MAYEGKDQVWRLLLAQDKVLRACLDSLLQQYLGGEGLPRSSAGAGGADPYRVLGLERNATDDEVKRRYRDFLRLLHPDTAGVRGTEFLLESMLAAYRLIAKERGWG